MSDEEKVVDKSGSGVSDKIERIGEMVLAFAGTAYAIHGGYEGILNPYWSCIVLIVSFTLYQSTSVVKYIKHIK